MLIRVVSFDPSFRNFGVAHLLIDSKSFKITPVGISIIKTKSFSGRGGKKNSDDLRCAKELCTGVEVACIGYDIAIAEVPHGSQSSRASWSLGIALGVLGSCKIPLVEVSASDVKFTVSGNRQKKIDKNKMIAWATNKYPQLKWKTIKRKGKLQLLKENEHMADAIAAAHAGILTRKFKEEVTYLVTGGIRGHVIRKRLKT